MSSPAACEANSKAPIANVATRVGIAAAIPLNCCTTAPLALQLESRARRISGDTDTSACRAEPRRALARDGAAPRGGSVDRARSSPGRYL